MANRFIKQYPDIEKTISLYQSGMTQKEVGEELKYYRLPKMQEKFMEAMGPLRDRDVVYYNSYIVGYCEDCVSNNEYVPRFMNKVHDNTLIRLPLPIDPTNPERGILGMLERQWTLSPVLGSSRFCICHGEEILFADTPTLALLKALAHQWEVEVEK